MNIVTPSEDTKILEFNQDKKSDKVPFSIYADRECLIEKIDRCKKNPENSSTSKLSKHIPSGSSTSTISSLKSIENKYDVYKRKNCEFLREHAMEIINFKKKNEVINKRAARIK